MTFPGTERTAARRRPDAADRGGCARAQMCASARCRGAHLQPLGGPRGIPPSLPPRTPTCRIGSLETMSRLPLFFLPTSPELLTSHRQPGSWGNGGETTSVGPGRLQVSGLIVLSDGFHHTSTADVCCRRLRIINSSLSLLVRALNATKGFKYLLFPTAWVSCSQTKRGDFLSSRKPEISSS